MNPWLNAMLLELHILKLHSSTSYDFCDSKRNHERNQRCWKLHRKHQYRSH